MSKKSLKLRFCIVDQFPKMQALQVNEDMPFHIRTVKIVLTDKQMKKLTLTGRYEEISNVWIERDAPEDLGKLNERLEK